jgi:hypothetical protein
MKLQFENIEPACSNHCTSPSPLNLSAENLRCRGKKTTEHEESGNVFDVTFKKARCENILSNLVVPF